jgi:hypothetical protein
MGVLGIFDCPKAWGVYQEELWGPASLSSCSRPDLGTGPIVARPGHLLCNMSHCGIILGTELGLL